MSSKKL